MDNQNNYNDQNFPIEPIWALKSTLISLIWLPFAAGFLSFFIWSYLQIGNKAFTDVRGLIYAAFFVAIVPIHFFINVLRRATFHYAVEDKFLNLNQGIIRKQSRQLPYGVIQNIILKQGILDRIFGLSTLIIQNASSPTTIKNDQLIQAGNSAGFFGNTISIPGLTSDNASKLKDILLGKIKSSPIKELGL